MFESISTNPSIHEKELNILFGDGTDAKLGLDKLKEQVEYDRLPEALKDTITSNTQVEEKEEKEKQETEVEQDLISSHNSPRLVEELPITKNTDEETEEISSHNSSRVLEEVEITRNENSIQENGNISSHNFVENSI